MTSADGTSITTWSDRISSRAATQASDAPIIKVNIQGGQSVIRFGATTRALIIASNNLTRNVPSMMIITVVAVSNAGNSNYQTVLSSEISGSSPARCGVYLRQSKVEAGGRRLDANSFQGVQGGSTSNNTFTVASGFFDYDNANLYVYERGTETARSGGFQTSGNTSDTASSASIGANSASGSTGERLNGDVGMAAFVQSNSTALRRRFEHSAAFSFKIACN